MNRNGPGAELILVMRLERKHGFAAEDVYDKGFFIRSKDGRYSLALNGGSLYAYGQGNNFDVALAHLAFYVFDPKVKYFFQYETTTLGNSNRSTLLDWWMQYHSPYLRAQAGRFLLPYSRQFYDPGHLVLSEADYAFNLGRLACI